MLWLILILSSGCLEPEDDEVDHARGALGDTGAAGSGTDGGADGGSSDGGSSDGGSGDGGSSDGGSGDGGKSDGGADTGVDTAARWDGAGDFETLCSEIWQPNECADGCADTTVEATYEAAFLTHAANVTGFSAKELGERIVLRRVVTGEATSSSATNYAFIVRLDWVEINLTQYAAADGPNPSEAAVLAELEQYDWFPKPNWEAPVASFEELDAEVAACEAWVGTTFPFRGWCQGDVTNEADATGETYYLPLSVDLDETRTAVMHLFPENPSASTCRVHEPSYD